MGIIYREGSRANADGKIPFPNSLDPPLSVFTGHFWRNNKTMIITRQRQTYSLFFIFPPIFEKVVKWGSGSFEFYLLVRVISSWIPFDPGPFKGCYSVTSAERTFLMRQEAWSRRNIKTSFPNRCSGILLVESIEGWWKKQDETSKQTSSDHQTTWVTRGTARRAWRHTFTKSDRK